MVKTSKTLRRKIIADANCFCPNSLKVIVAELALWQRDVSRKVVARDFHPSGHWGHRPRIMPLLTQQRIKGKLKFASGCLKHNDWR